MRDILQGQRSIRLRKLTDEQCRKIHEASLELLARVGVEVHHEKARELFRRAGARLEGERVFLPTELVEWGLSVSPRGFVLHDRGGAPVMPVEGTNVFFGCGSETPTMIDHRTWERRRGTLADVAEGVRLIDALPNFDWVMSLFVPWELPPQLAYLEQFRLMLSHTTKPNLFLSPQAEDVKVMVRMLEVLAGSPQALRERPRGMCYINVTHPLRHEWDELEKAIFLAEKAVPFSYNPAVLRGLSGPITVAGAHAVGNAGELLGLVLAQLVREGAPVSLSGGTVDKTDLKTMTDVYSAPENRITFAEMANWYDKPHFGLGGVSDSKVVDGQAAAEAALTLLTEALAGSNLIHDVGYLESGMTNCLAQLAICDELIGWVRRLMAPIEVDQETLALDVIERVAQGSDYLLEDHTLAHVQDDWYPALFDHRSHDKWMAAGGKDLAKKAAERVERLLADHEVQPLPEEVADEFALILEERRRAE
jgi:trimethylamine---corrinoid protein Co-methyltransferase